MSNFKMWYSANVQLLKKNENRKISPMLEFGDRIMGDGKGINGQCSELRGLDWFLRASKAAAVKAEKGKKPYALVVDCNEIIETLEKHYKDKEEYPHLFEIVYKTRAKAKAALDGADRGAEEDFAKAEEYGKIAKKKAEEAEAYRAKLAKLEKMDYAGLIEELTKAMEDDPEKADACLRNISYFRYQMKDYAGAAEACTKAIGMKPDDAALYSWRGTVKFKMGDRSAIADCDKARELDPKGTYDYPGMSQYQATAEDYDKAVLFYPDKPEPYLGRARNKHHGKLVDLAGAVEDYTKAIELLRGKPETLENLEMLRDALSGRGRAKYRRSEVSGLFSVTNYSGWKEDETDAMALYQRIDAMERQAKKEKKPSQAASG